MEVRRSFRGREAKVMPPHRDVVERKTMNLEMEVDVIGPDRSSREPAGHLQRETERQLARPSGQVDQYQAGLDGNPPGPWDVMTGDIIPELLEVPVSLESSGHFDLLNRSQPLLPFFNVLGMWLLVVGADIIPYFT